MHRSFQSHICLLLLLLLPATLLAQGEEPKTLEPGEYIISGLEVEGTGYTNPRSIELLSGLQIGQQISVPGDALSGALRALWDQELFSDIELIAEKVEGNKLFLKIKVIERPRISKYTFQGIKKNQSEDLREEIRFIRGQRFTETKERTAKRIIRNYFNEKGYLNVETNVITNRDTAAKNAVVVVMDIDKGKKVKIDDIVIQGNQVLEEKKMKRQLKETKEKKFWRLWKRSKYIPALWAEDKDRLVAYMRSEGFRDAEIVSDSVIPIDEKSVALKVDIYEGKRYYIRDIEWEGNNLYSTGYLDTLLGVNKGDIYNQQLLESRVQMDPNGRDISSLYLDDGYLFFRADIIETAIVEDSVDLVIRMFEGPQATYNRIIIEGNDKTSDHVIQRSLRTIPGEKFSRSEVIRSQRELMALGYFNPENLQVIPQPNPEDGTVDIKYIVEEKPNDQIFFQGGWGGRVRDANGNVLSNGLVATLGLTLNNFSTRKIFKRGGWNPIPAGDGQRLNLQVQVSGRAWQTYRIGFTEPWLGGKKPTSLGVNAYYSQQQALQTDYRLRIVGSSIDLGRRLEKPDDNFRSFTSASYRFYDVQNGRGVFPGFDEGRINIISLTQTFERNTVFEPIYPRSGSIVRLSVEATPPWNLFRTGDDKLRAEDPADERYKLLEFHKWKFRTETYMRLFGNMVLMPRMEFGYLGAYDSDLGISPFERFYLGGNGLFGWALDGREIISFRGYDNNYIYMGDEGRDGNPIYQKYTLELRQPISLEQSATVWVHLFAEAGNTWESFDTFKPFNLYRSAGIGTRIFLPIFGMLGVDFGYGFDPLRYEGERIENDTRQLSGFQINFTIGQQF